MLQNKTTKTYIQTTRVIIHCRKICKKAVKKKKKKWDWTTHMCCCPTWHTVEISDEGFDARFLCVLWTPLRRYSSLFNYQTQPDPQILHVSYDRVVQVTALKQQVALGSTRATKRLKEGRSFAASGQTLIGHSSVVCSLRLSSVK